MAISTISTIQGQLGLPSDASTSAISDAEKSIFQSVQDLLRQTRSDSLESLTSRGLGRSSFGEQAMNKQETDVMNNAINNIAQYRMNFADKQINTNNDLLKLAADANFKANLEGEKIKSLGEAQTQVQMSQWIPTAILKQLDSFSDSSPETKAPLIDWLISLTNKKSGDTITPPSDIWGAFGNVLGNIGGLTGLKI